MSNLQILMTKNGGEMEDLELKKRVAIACGLEIETKYNIVFARNPGEETWIIFNPLTSWSQLMEIVIPRLQKKKIRIEIENGEFALWRLIETECQYEPMGQGSYPADFARAVCKALVEEKGEV